MKINLTEYTSEILAAAYRQVKTEGARRQILGAIFMKNVGFMLLTFARRMPAYPVTEEDKDCFLQHCYVWMYRALKKYDATMDCKFLSFYAYYLQAAVNSYQSRIYGLGGLKSISNWKWSNKQHEADGAPQYIKKYPSLVSMNNRSASDTEYIDLQKVGVDDSWERQRDAKLILSKLENRLSLAEKKYFMLWKKQIISDDCLYDLGISEGLGCKENIRQKKKKITKKARRLRCELMSMDSI